MAQRFFVTGALAVLPAIAMSQAQPAAPRSDAPQTIRASIDVTKTGDPINPLLWGTSSRTCATGSSVGCGRR